MMPWVERDSIDVPLDGSAEQRFAKVPEEALLAVRRLLKSLRDAMPASAQKLARIVDARTLWRFHREAAEVAQFADVDWQNVLLANLVYDFVVGSIGCSTIALPTPNGPVLARNMDFFPEDLLAQGSYLVRYTRSGTVQFVQAGWPGAIGIVSGQSARGFAVVLNAVAMLNADGRPDGLRKLGYPVLLHLRRVVEDAHDFDHALDLLAKTTLMTSALFTLVGTENDQRVVVERSPRGHALRWPRGTDPLVITNDYRLLEQPTPATAGNALNASTCLRFESLSRFFADHRSEQAVDDVKLLYALTDPSVIQTITAQHIIFRPRPGTARLFVPRRFVAPGV